MAAAIEDGLPSYFDENVPWFVSELTESQLDPATRDLLEKYSGIAPAEVLPHVHKVRDQAFEICKYPCIGEFRFLQLRFSQLDWYNAVLERVKAGDTVLDLGCCFGQDIRKLVADGAPSENLFGCDLRKDFTDLGYDLFLDRNTLRSTFMAADVFAENSALDNLDGRIDIIIASSFLHLFDWNQQKQVASRIIRLLKDRKGSVLMGRQVGNFPHGQNIYRRGQGYMFRHDPESLKKFWDEVGAETNTSWKVEAHFRGRFTDTISSDKKWHSEGAKPIVFAVWKQ